MAMPLIEIRIKNCGRVQDKTSRVSWLSKSDTLQLGLCVLDADAHSDAQSDAQSDADERSHVLKFPRSDKNDSVPWSVCQATIFS